MVTLSNISETLEKNRDEIDNSVYEALRGDANLLAQTLREEQFYAEDRREMHGVYLQTLKKGARLTTQNVTFAHVPPDEDPSTEEMAGSISRLAGTLVTENIRDNITKTHIIGFRDSIASFLSAIEEADEFPYAFKEESVEKEYNRAVQSIGVRHDVDPDKVLNGDGREVFAGPRARKQIEQIPRLARENPDYDPPLAVGTGTKNNRDTFFNKDHLFRHRAIVGVTGYGKSTLMTNDMKQIIEAGNGLCFIEPKGEDSQRMMELIPDERLDDVVWIEPGASGKYVSGFNFISVGLDPDDSSIESAVSNLVSDLKKMLGAGKYWGPRMDRIAGNLIRAMNVYNRRNPEEPDLNLADLYYVLADKKSRYEFLVKVRAEGIDFIEDYTQEIAEMESDKLEPILGRMQPWIEEPLARRMICFRDAEINIPEAVEDDKIIILRMSDEPDELKKMLGMALIRRIWATIRSRADEAEHARSPFYLFADEFHYIVQADETIPKMLAAARSFRLSINLATQALSQLPDNVVEQMLVNCDTINAFNAGSNAEARRISPQLDVEPQTLLNEPNYHIRARITSDETMELTDPFQVYVHPPFPPLRTRDEAKEHIENSLNLHGRTRMSPKELKADLLFHKGQGRFETGIGEEIAMMESDPDIPPQAIAGAIDNEVQRQRALKEEPDEDTPEDATGQAVQNFIEEHEQSVLEGIYAARLIEGLPPGSTVPPDIAQAEIEWRVGGTDHDFQFNNLIEQAPADLVVQERRDGAFQVGLTAKGRGQVVSQSSGSSSTAGGPEHRLKLRESFVAFTAMGYHTTIPTQQDDTDMDGLADPPINPHAEGTTKTEIESLEQELKDNYPEIWTFSQGQPISIEAETTTFKSPAKTIRNFRKAINDGRFCAFVTKDASSEDGKGFGYYGERIEKALFDKESPNRAATIDYDTLLLAQHTDENGNRTFYNNTRKYTLKEGVKAVRPATDKFTVWEETDDGRIIAKDAENGVVADFPDAEAVYEGNRAAVNALSEYDHEQNQYVVRTDGETHTYENEEALEEDWSLYNEPHIPEQEFDRKPTTDDFAIIIVPDADNEQYDEPQLYHRGDLTPLYEHVGANKLETADSIPDPNAETPTGAEAAAGPSSKSPAEPATPSQPSPSSDNEDVELHEPNGASDDDIAAVFEATRPDTPEEATSMVMDQITSAEPVNDNSDEDDSDDELSEAEIQQLQTEIRKQARGEADENDDTDDHDPFEDGEWQSGDELREHGSTNLGDEVDIEAPDEPEPDDPDDIAQALNSTDDDDTDDVDLDW